MEVEEIFEEWDELETIDLDELEGFFNEEATNTEEEISDQSESDESDESDDEEDPAVLKCKKCGKTYHVKGWLTRHEKDCDGIRSTKRKRRSKKTEHQKNTRKVLANLGLDEYFDEKCTTTVKKLLQDIVSAPLAQAKLKGERFIQCQIQAVALLEKITGASTEVMDFIRRLTKRLWEICLTKMIC